MLRQALLIAMLMCVGLEAKAGIEWYETEQWGRFVSIKLTTRQTNLNVNLNSGTNGKPIYIDLINGEGLWGYFNWFNPSIDQRPITKIVILTGKEWAYENNKTYEKDGYTYHPVPVEDGLNGDLNQGAGGDWIYLYYSKDHPEKGYIAGMKAAYYGTWAEVLTERDDDYFDKDLNDGCGFKSDYVYIAACEHKHNCLQSSFWVNDDGYYCAGYKDCSDKNCQTKSELKGDGSEEQPIMIGNMNQYKDFVSLFNYKAIRQNAYVELTADFSGVFNEVPQIGLEDYSFKGTFDGKGHTLTNVFPTDFKDFKIHSGLFKKTYNAKIRNFTLEKYVTAARGMHFGRWEWIPDPDDGYESDKKIWVRYELPNEGNQSIWSILSDWDGYSEFENVHLKDCDFGLGPNNNDYFGAFAGFSSDTRLTNCSFTISDIAGIDISGNRNSGMIGRAGLKTYITGCYCLSYRGTPANLIYDYHTNSEYLSRCEITNSFAENKLVAQNYMEVLTNSEGDVDESRFATGEITYRLNGSENSDNPVWRQRLGTNKIPTIQASNDNIVYQNRATDCQGREYVSVFTNDPNELPEGFKAHKNVEIVKYLGGPTCVHPITLPDASAQEYFMCTECHHASLDNVNFNISPITTPSAHYMEHADNVFTCKSGGHIEHWNCTECGFNFSSDDATTDEHYIADVDIPAHKVVKKNKGLGTVSTCLKEVPDAGYWHCNTCEKNYYDEATTQEINSKLTHTLHHVAESYHNSSEEGYEDLPNGKHAHIAEFWICENCGNSFSAEEPESDASIIYTSPVFTEDHTDQFMHRLETVSDPVDVWSCLCNFNIHYKLNVAGKDGQEIDDPTGSPAHTYNLHSLNLDVNSPIKLSADIDYHITTNTVTYNGSILANRQWSTLCLPFAFNADNIDGVTFYVPRSLEVSASENTLVLEPVRGTIEAATPLFVWRNSEDKSESQEYTISIDKPSPLVLGNHVWTSPDGNLKAHGSFYGYQVNCGKVVINGVTYYGAEYGKNIYYLSGDQLWKTTGVTDVKPYRIYLELPNANNVKVIRMDNGVVDKIDLTNSEDIHGNIYNTGGVLLNKMQRGVNIVNGKKIIKK